MNRGEEDAWIHGKILADALRQQVRTPGTPLPIGIEASFQFFDIKSGDSEHKTDIVSCQVCRIDKEGPGRWCVMEDNRVFRFRHRGNALESIMKVLSTGLAARDGSFYAEQVGFKVDALRKAKTRAIDQLKKEGAVNTANYLHDAIKIENNGEVSIHNLKNSGRLIFG